MSSDTQDEQKQIEPRSDLVTNEATSASSLQHHHRPVSPMLPVIPVSNLDLETDLSSILGPSKNEVDKVQKRASNVLKLSKENEQLAAELKAMTDRLEAVERRRQELTRKQQQILEP